MLPTFWVLNWHIVISGEDDLPRLKLGGRLWTNVNSPSYFSVGALVLRRRIL